MLFSNPKPIERWYCNGYEEAREKCKENQNRNCWVFLKIQTEEVILEEQIKELKSLKRDLIEITPVLPHAEEMEEEEMMRQEENVVELFKRFYKNTKNVEANEEILTLLQNLIGEDDT